MPAASAPSCGSRSSASPCTASTASGAPTASTEAAAAGLFERRPAGPEALADAHDLHARAAPPGLRLGVEQHLEPARVDVIDLREVEHDGGGVVPQRLQNALEQGGRAAFELPGDAQEHVPV